MQIETIRSMMVLAGGALAFLGAVLSFINNRLQQAQTTEEKAKIYGNLLSFAIVFLFLAVGIFGAVFKSFWPLAALTLFCFMVNCYWFITSKSKISRREIAILIGLASCFIMTLLLAFIFDILKVLESMVLIVGKLVK